MAVSPLGAEPMTVEEVLDTSWPSDLYSLLDAAVPSFGTLDWAGRSHPHTLQHPRLPGGAWGAQPSSLWGL